ncbi:adenosylmethionine--8-amino-7-oxononanoate transaminase [Leptolyngbya sp. FACHB-711]|uniref:adenosylmethionine--8-amino-7-oxononanoate transaminase n=1 Tax=unclassified Leptolyngbya TaxID=2650499 RepID=UPI001682467A|nr:adenosylmethionine--8-amino-7-oxononanoate transaminase [Leptolyngbya sp. FACHB-711]MBD1852342.1 adenosylmethionine--8-amino-7-oxononanoate transaminase [Cyanobacteria bacterium FACHB-502]MBD2025079.1 adenosylmethionine--8-amino-7-oxononanoate transaminase [Leptolyngbya sp. FACHB-711]
MAHPHLWYPFTQAKTAPEPLKVKSAQGVWLELENGQRLLDCISSWWVNLHGHAHPKIAEAIYQQAQQLEQVIFAGFTHDPAEQIATKLIEKLPAKSNRVFFSDNGSTAIEVALKMAYQYWTNQQQKRSTFIAFEGAYHGDTFGAMAVGTRSIFTQPFDDLLFRVEFVSYPETYWGDNSIEEKEDEILFAIQQKLQQSDQYAGILIEPLIQGAGGMRMCRSVFLQKLAQLAKDAKTLLIFDEIMTGFGRTGEWFSCVKAGVEPDLLCLSKGITGGFLPLSVTVSSEAIYQAFYSDDLTKTFFHGHSYTANPLGCAAALASLELMQENESKFRGMEALHWQNLESLKALPNVEKLRVTGTIAAFDIKTNDQPGYLNQIAGKIRTQAIDRGLLLRPLGNVLYLMPPYCITEAELEWVYQNLTAILAELQGI